ncbi:uncharacterized protein LOC135478127 [Liolophura sinensis]|uniref:uncharacterized protein LOC135478127 n=1 Tax=Liolophura sinensis TaxID=3198878 RepID=UPI0031591B23
MCKASEANGNTLPLESQELLPENAGLGKRKGLKAALLGVTFIDLLHLTETDVKTGSYLFVVSGLGSILGSVVAGFLCDRGYADVTLTTSLLITGVFGALIPWPTSFALLLSVNFVTSVGMGFTETVVPFLVVQQWFEDHAAYNQLVYFCFSVGGILGPVIAEPFLNPLSTTSMLVNNVSSAHLNPGNPTSEVKVTDDGVQTKDVGLIYMPFLIFGAIALFSAALSKTASCANKHRYKTGTNSEERENNNLQSDSRELWSYPLFVFLAFVAVFFALFYGVEDGIQNYVTTILVHSMDWSKSDGAKATTVFWKE